MKKFARECLEILLGLIAMTLGTASGLYLMIMISFPPIDKPYFRGDLDRYDAVSIIDGFGIYIPSFPNCIYVYEAIAITILLSILVWYICHIWRTKKGMAKNTGGEWKWNTTTKSCRLAQAISRKNTTFIATQSLLSATFLMQKRKRGKKRPYKEEEWDSKLDFYKYLEDEIAKDIFEMSLFDNIYRVVVSLIAFAAMVAVIYFGVTVLFLPIWIVCMGYGMMTGKGR